MIGPAVSYGLSNLAYHASDGLSSTQLNRLLRSPFHYRATLGDRKGSPASKPTPAMENGTRVHCALLEPREFPKRYVIGPNVSKLTNVWKDFVVVATERGQDVITQEEWDRAFAQATALRALPEVADLLDDGAPEVSAYWTDHDEQGGDPVLCRCRPDWVGYVAGGAGAVLLDVKTSADASPHGFASSVAKFGYHVQQAHYELGFAAASGLEIHGFVFAVVESEFPHAAMAYMLDDEAVAHGRRKRHQALALYRQCRRDDKWPCYGDGIQSLSLPRWSLYE